MMRWMFAQVINPPIDPIRESIVMSLKCPVGPEGNLLDASNHTARRLEVEELDHETVAIDCIGYYIPG